MFTPGPAMAMLLVLHLPPAWSSRLVQVGLERESEYPCYTKGLTGAEYARRRWLIGGFQLLFRDECPTEADHRLSKFVGEFWDISPLKDAKFCQELFKRALNEGTSPILLRRVLEVHRHGLASINGGFEAHARELSLGTMFKILSGGFYHKVEQYIKWLSGTGTHDEYIKVVTRNREYLEKYISRQWILTNPDPCFLALALYDLEQPVDVHLVHTRHNIDLASKVDSREEGMGMEELAEDIDLRHGLLTDAVQLLSLEWDPSELGEPFSSMDLDGSLAWDDARGDFVREQGQAVHAYLLGGFLEAKVPWQHIGKFFADYATSGGDGGGLSLPKDDILFLGHEVMAHVGSIGSNEDSEIHPRQYFIPAASLRAIFDLLASLPQLDSYQQQVRFARDLDERLGLFILAEVYFELGDYDRALRVVEDFQEQECIRWALVQSERDILNVGDGQWISLWRALSGLLASKRLVLSGRNGEAGKVLEPTFDRLLSLQAKLSKSGGRAEPLASQTRAILARVSLLTVEDTTDPETKISKRSNPRPLIHHPSTWMGLLEDELVQRRGVLEQSSLLQNYFLSELERQELGLEERSYQLQERLKTLCKDAATLGKERGGPHPSCFASLQEAILETAKLLLTPTGGLLWKQVQETYGLLYLAKRVRQSVEEHNQKRQLTAQPEMDTRLTQQVTTRFLTRKELEGEIPEGRRAKVAQERLEYLCKKSKSSEQSCYERLQSSIITMAVEHSEPVEGFSMVDLAQRLGLATLLGRTRNHLNVSQQAMAICLGLPSRQQLRGQSNETLIRAEERATERSRLIATLDKTFGERGRLRNFLNVLLHMERMPGSGSRGPVTWPAATPPRLLASLEGERETERMVRERERRESLLQMQKLQTEAQLREEEARRALSSMQGHLEILLNNQKSGVETTVRELQSKLEISEGQYNALVSWLRVHLHTEDFMHELEAIESTLGAIPSRLRLSELARSLREERDLMYRALGGERDGGGGGSDRASDVKALLGKILESLMGETGETIDLSITVPEAVKTLKESKLRELRALQERSDRARREVLLRYSKVRDTLRTVQSYFYGELGPSRSTRLSGDGDSFDSAERAEERLLKRMSRLCDRPANCLAQLETTAMHIGRTLQVTGGERRPANVLSTLRDIHRVAEQTRRELVETMEERSRGERALHRVNEALKRAQDTELVLGQDLRHAREQVQEKTRLGERLERSSQLLHGQLLLCSQEARRLRLFLVSNALSRTPIRPEELSASLNRRVQLERMRTVVAPQPGDDMLECLDERMHRLRALETSTASEEQVRQVRKMESILGEDYTLDDLEERVTDLHMAERGNNLMDILMGYQQLLKRGIGPGHGGCPCPVGQWGMGSSHLGGSSSPLPRSISPTHMTVPGGGVHPFSPSLSYTVQGQEREGLGRGETTGTGTGTASSSATAFPSAPLESGFARTAILAQSIGKMARSVRHQLSLEEIVRDFEASKFDLAQRYADAQATVGSLRDENAILTERIETFLRSTTSEALHKLNVELQLMDREKQQYLREALRAETRYTQLMGDLRSSLGVGTIEEAQLEFFSVHEAIRRLFQEDGPGPLSDGIRLSERLLALHFETTRLRAQCPAVGLITLDRETMLKRVERAVETSRQIAREGSAATGRILPSPRRLAVRAQASARTAAPPTAEHHHLDLACKERVSQWRTELQEDTQSLLPVKCVSSIPPEELAAMDRRELAWVPVEGLTSPQLSALPPERLDWFDWSSLSGQSAACHAFRAHSWTAGAPSPRGCSHIRTVCNLNMLVC